MAKPASDKGMRGAVKKVSMGARALDAFLCLLFAYFAYTSTGGWQIFWAASSIFCAFTAITAPIDRLPALIGRIMGMKKG